MSVLTATPEPGADRPRVKLAVTGAPVGDLPVVRVAADGSTVLLPSGIKVTSGGAGTGFDYRAPFETGVRYETVETTPASSASVVLDVGVAWLVHPFQPTLSLPVQGTSDQATTFTRDAFKERSRPSSTGFFEPLGRDDPIAVRVGRRRSRLSSMSIRTYTLEQDVALDQLVDDDSPLLLNVPPSLRWGVAYQWVALGQVDDSRLGIEGAHEYREWTLPFRVVAEPVGELRSEWTSGDALEAFDSSLSASRAYATAGDAEIDLRRAA